MFSRRTQQAIVYTALTDDRDTLRSPEIVTFGVRYICMSNHVKPVWPWEIVSIPYANDPVRQARWCKLQAYKQLDTVYTIWMDATYCPRNDMWALIHRHLMNCSIAAFPHFERKCIYAEAEEVLRHKLDDKEVVERQMRVIADSGYPRNNGLFDTSILVRRRSTIINTLCDMWWGFVENGSKRDQLSFNYVLWKLGVKCGTLKPGVTRMCNSIDTTFQPYFSAIFH